MRSWTKFNYREAPRSNYGGHGVSLEQGLAREDTVYRVSGSGERGDKVALFCNDKPAATRGNCNNYAKTECNGASRRSEQGGPGPRTEELKGKKRRTFQGAEAQKEQREARWWRRWHAKEAS